MASDQRGSACPEVWYGSYHTGAVWGKSTDPAAPETRLDEAPPSERPLGSASPSVSRTSDPFTDHKDSGVFPGFDARYDPGTLNPCGPTDHTLEYETLRT